MTGRVNVVLGYVVGNRYHESYFHSNFEVVGGSERTGVIVRDLGTGVERTHFTRNGKFVIPAGMGCNRRHDCDGCPK